MAESDVNHFGHMYYRSVRKNKKQQAKHAKIITRHSETRLQISERLSSQHDDKYSLNFATVPYLVAGMPL